MAKQSFGKTIKKRRKYLGLKAIELAKKAAIDKTYLSKIENHNYLPSKFAQKKISKALGIDLSKIYLDAKIAEKFGKMVRLSPITWSKEDDLRGDLMHHIMNEEGTYHRAFAMKYLNRLNPKKAKDKKFIDALIQCITKWRRKRHDFWDEYYKDTEKFVKDTLRG